MLQRIQTVYLLIVATVMGALQFWLPLYTNEAGEKIMAQNDIMYIVCFLGSAALALIAIFLFKNRKRQFVLNRLNIILNFILLGVLVYLLLNLSGETAVSEKGIGMFLPIISIVFLVLANKAIKKDEDLVKSVDRLR